MQFRVRTGSTLAMAGAWIAMSGVLLAQAAPGQDLAPVTAAQETISAPESLAGQWHLNKELSTLPQLTSTSEEPAQPSGGRRPGGGGGGGYGGGGYGGRGGFGGRGGRGGAGGSGGSNPQVMSDDMLKMRGLMRVLAEPAELLTILVSPSEVTTTDQHGAVLKFKTDGKKQEINFGPGAVIDTKAKWDGGVLSLELTAGSMKLTETYGVTKESHMLVIAVQPASGKNAGGRPALAPLKFVYGRGE